MGGWGRVMASGRVNRWERLQEIGVDVRWVWVGMDGGETLLWVRLVWAGDDLFWSHSPHQMERVAVLRVVELSPGAAVAIAIV